MSDNTVIQVPLDPEAQVQALIKQAEIDPTPQNKVVAARAISQMMVYKELKLLFSFHWSNIGADSNAFFAMVYGQYTTATGTKTEDEEGVRGVTFLRWDNIDHVRANVKGAKRKQYEVKTQVTYVPIQRISRDSNAKVLELVKEYDPTDSFVVCMWCENPSFIDAKILKRGVRPEPPEVEVVIAVPPPPFMEADGTLSIKCARPECKVTSTKQKLSACGRCRNTPYCSKTCLIADRPRHKSACSIPVLPLP